MSVNQTIFRDIFKVYCLYFDQSWLILRSSTPGLSSLTSSAYQEVRKKPWDRGCPLLRPGQSVWSGATGTIVASVGEVWSTNEIDTATKVVTCKCSSKICCEWRYKIYWEYNWCQTRGHSWPVVIHLLFGSSNVDLAINPPTISLHLSHQNGRHSHRKEV